ncbi:MAG: hypothetical protein GYB31_05630 [Bacteroidetes bacterium]|nr:hypothetical protein [Bacteroidota bacterium]
MNKKLKSIAGISFGTYQKTSSEAGIPYLLANQFDEGGRLIAGFEQFVPSTVKGVEKHCLQNGDLLLAGKGFRNFSWQYNKQLGQIIPSSLFFIIRPDQSLLLPGFLNVFLNLPNTQSRLRIMGEGTKIPSIRKTELEELRIPVPTLEIQQKIVEIHRLHKSDIALTESIINQKKNLFTGVVNNLITE